MMDSVIDIKAPVAWNQLTLKQLYIVAELFDLDLDRDTLLLVSFCRLAGLKILRSKGEVLFEKGKTRFKLEAYQIKEFSEKMAFLLDEYPVDIVNPTKINGHLLDTKFGSYFYADAMMLRYSITHKRRFIRKALKELGQRCRFISRRKAVAVSLWWQGVQGYIEGLYPLVFHRSKGGEPQTKSPFLILQDLFLMLNDNRPQDNKLIEESDVHGVLSALNNKIDQYNKEKEALKKK